MKTKSLLALAAATIFSLSANATVHFDQLDLGDFSNPTDQISGQNLEQAPFNLYYTHSGSQFIYNADEIADLFDHDCAISSITFIYGDLSWQCYPEFSFEIGGYIQLIDEEEFAYVDNTTYWFKPENKSVLATGTLEYTWDNYGENIPVTLTFDTPFEIKAADKGKNLLLTCFSNASDVDDFSNTQNMLPYVYNNSLRNYRMACYGYDHENEDFLEIVEAGAMIKNTAGTHSDAYKYDLPIARIAYSWDDTPAKEEEEEEEGGGTTSIDQVSVNGDAAVEYFNLQGMKIDRPAAGQVVIRRAGNTTSKVIIR
ncbi:MAG: hypothetical protein NC098_02565 [Lachnoclostridium sp.]|nr:hypothetical protein [Lachnoclostridium sp.]